MLMLASTGRSKATTSSPPLNPSLQTAPFAFLRLLHRPHFLPGLELADPTTRIYTLSIYSATYLDW